MSSGHAGHGIVAGEADGQRHGRVRNFLSLPVSGTGGCPSSPAIRGVACGGNGPSLGTGPPVKFLADMGISPQTVDFLQTLGHDAVHFADQGLGRSPDKGD